MRRTCGEPNESKENAHPKNVTPLFPAPRYLGPRKAEALLAYASRAVQFHPHGGQSEFVWLPARTPPCGCIVRVVSQTKSRKIPAQIILPLFFRDRLRCRYIRARLTVHRLAKDGQRHRRERRQARQREAELRGSEGGWAQIDVVMIDELDQAAFVSRYVRSVAGQRVARLLPAWFLHAPHGLFLVRRCRYVKTGTPVILRSRPAASSARSKEAGGTSGAEVEVEAEAEVEAGREGARGGWADDGGGGRADEGEDEDEGEDGYDDGWEDDEVCSPGMQPSDYGAMHTVDNLANQPMHGTVHECAAACRAAENCVAFSWKVGASPVRVSSRSISPQWRSIRFRLALRTYAPWGYIARVVSQTKSRKYPPGKYYRSSRDQDVAADCYLKDVVRANRELIGKWTTYITSCPDGDGDGDVTI